MNYVLETYGSSQISVGLGGSLNLTSGLLEITGVVPDSMIHIDVFLNTGYTSDHPSLSNQEGLTLINQKSLSQSSEGSLFYSGVFMATASTVKLVFSKTTPLTTYGFSASQLSIS